MGAPEWGTVRFASRPKVIIDHGVSWCNSFVLSYLHEDDHRKRESFCVTHLFSITSAKMIKFCVFPAPVSVSAAVHNGQIVKELTTEFA